MKTFISTILLLLIFNLGKTQSFNDENRFAERHGMTISLGYGTPSIIRTYLKIKNTHNDYWIKGSGPYMFKFEYLLLNRISIGLNATYSASKIAWMDDGYDTTIHDVRPYEYGIKAKELSGLLRTNYHFGHRKKLDTYVGLGFGYGYITLKSYSTAPLNQINANNSVPRPITLEATYGMRYYFSKNIALYTELGLGKSWIILHKYFLPESIIQLGLNIKLK